LNPFTINVDDWLTRTVPPLVTEGDGSTGSVPSSV
jgi:hypothetical protein